MGPLKAVHPNAFHTAACRLLDLEHRVMSSRSEMDRPAVVLTAVVAVALIAVSGPFTLLWWGEGNTEYAVDWESVETASGQARITAAPQTQTAEIPAGDILTSFVTLAVPQCTDGAQAPLTQPATISWTLSYRMGNDTSQVGQGSFTCAQRPTAEQSFARHPEPNLGSREVEMSDDEAEERAAARASIWSSDLYGGLNETGTYVLEVTSSRPASTLPGVPAPALSATLDVKVHRWQDLLQEVADDEVVR
jgi:hypothetical protein